MFKAQHKIKIQCDKFINDDAIQVAPFIDLNGICLSSNQEIPAETYDFLSSRGASILTIVEDDEMYIRLSGKFELSKAEVEEFFKSNPDTKSNVFCDDPRRQAVIFKEILSKKIQSPHSRAYTFLFTDEEGDTVPIDIIASIFQSGKTMTFSSGEATSFSGTECFSGETMTFNSETTVLKGAVIEGTRAGVLSQLLANEDISMKSTKKTQIIDTLVASGESIEIEAGGEFYAAMDPNFHWGNDPKIPSLKI